MKVTITDTKTGKEKSMSPRFAKILTSMGRAQYLTRDMAAGTVPMTVSEPAQVTADSMIVSDESDSAGTKWDETLHTSTRLKNADGTWRKRPGAKAA